MLKLIFNIHNLQPNFLLNKFEFLRNEIEFFINFLSIFVLLFKKYSNTSLNMFPNFALKLNSYLLINLSCLKFDNKI